MRISFKYGKESVPMIVLTSVLQMVYQDIKPSGATPGGFDVYLKIFNEDGEPIEIGSKTRLGGYNETNIIVRPKPSKKEPRNTILKHENVYIAGDPDKNVFSMYSIGGDISGYR